MSKIAGSLATHDARISEDKAESRPAKKACINKEDSAQKPAPRRSPATTTKSKQATTAPAAAPPTPALMEPEPMPANAPKLLSIQRTYAVESAQKRGHSLADAALRNKRSHAFGEHVGDLARATARGFSSRVEGALPRSVGVAMPFADDRHGGGVTEVSLLHIKRNVYAAGVVISAGGPAFRGADVTGDETAKMMRENRLYVVGESEEVESDEVESEAAVADSEEPNIHQRQRARGAHLVGVAAAAQCMGAFLLLQLARGLAPEEQAGVAAAEAVLSRLEKATAWPAEEPDWQAVELFVHKAHQTLNFDSTRYHTDVMGKGLESKIGFSLGTKREQVQLPPSGSMSPLIKSALAFAVFGVQTLLGGIGNGDVDGDVELSEAIGQLAVHANLGDEARGVYIRSQNAVYAEGGVVLDHPFNPALP